ncbi:hypothetical protein [Mangrovicoccus ximenensis]|uniref:hypothetical protein n=1 Tax=Mangrovicoccus ximenensis TaxID=1911570 RepID=UPI000D395969|nr:hypothetical protein [Mangrovicoccus ximenensis]
MTGVQTTCSRDGAAGSASRYQAIRSLPNSTEALPGRSSTVALVPTAIGPCADTCPISSRITADTAGV